MPDVNGVTGSQPIAASGRVGRAIHVSPSRVSAVQTNRPTDAISFSQAAERLRASRPTIPTIASTGSPATYALGGLQATTPSAVKQALGQFVAARVSTPMDFQSGQSPSRNGALPFYTNPTLANSAATRTSAARLGTGLDTTG